MWLNMKDYSTLHSNTDWSKGTACSKTKYSTLHSDIDWRTGTWEIIQHYTQTQIEVTEQLVVRKNMDVYEHERLYNITRRNRLK